MSEQCQGCRFWDRYADRDESIADAGDCRRHPPRISDEMVRRHMSPPTYNVAMDLDDESIIAGLYCASPFPITQQTSWCGEFVAASPPSDIAEMRAVWNAAAINSRRTKTEQADLAAAGALNRLFSSILATPATNADDVNVKAMLIVANLAAGQVTTDDEAKMVADEAQRLGVGVEIA